MQIREFKWKSKELAQMKPLQQVEYLVVHHSDSRDVSIEEIDRWHKGNGWTGVGYHYVIRANGAVEKGRPDNKQGAHVLGHNHHSIGIVLTGNFMTGTPTQDQMNVLVELLAILKGRHPNAKVARHRDLMATSCPGDKFPWTKLIEMLHTGAGNQPEKTVIKAGGKVFDAIIINNTTFAPVRAVAEALGRTVTWDGVNRVVIIE